MWIRTLATAVTATVLTLVLAFFLAGQALAGDDGKRGHGKWHGAYHKHGGYQAHASHWRGHGKHRHGHPKHAYRGSHGKYEYRDGPCKIEEKWGPGGYKKEIKCRPARHHYHHYHHYHHGPIDLGWLFGPAFAQLMPGEALVWQDPAYGDRFEVVPTRDYRTAQGRYCREYQATATVGGRPQQTYGTACLQPDGDWQIVQ
ncbi:MAG: hypothetical protein ACFCUQ_19055 [Kiloniellales bacterium]